MKIKKLHLTNFRCFDSLNIEFDEQLTVLVAPNGAGKTTVLDAVAIGLGPFLTGLNASGINPKDTDFRVLTDGKNPEYMRLELETYEGLCWDRVVWGGKQRGKRKRLKDQKGLKALNGYADTLVNDLINGRHPEFPVIIYYGTGRGVLNTPQRRRDFQKSFTIQDGYRNALEAKANFKQFFEYFYFLEDLERRGKEEHRDWDYQQPELTVIREAISRMMPNFTNPRSALRPLRFLVDWEHDSKIQQLRIEQLSDGYRTTLAMVMDIAARMATANSLARSILDNEGIVLIDEVDLHLHPKWQQTILPDLMRTFPRVQFIVSTHSPQVLSTVPKECIRVLGNNMEGDAVAAMPIAFSYGEPSNDVLQAIMHVDPQPPVQEKGKLDELTSLVDQGRYKSKQAQKLLDELKQTLNEHHPQIAKIERSIRRQKALKG